MKVYHGWYSEKQHQEGGVCIYTLASDPTKHVVVSCVSTTMDHGCGWDDMEYVGEVLDCVKPIHGGLTGAERMKRLIARFGEDFPLNELDGPNGV